MNLDEFVEECLSDIKNGIDEFNIEYKEEGVIALYPDQLSLEVYIDEEGRVSDNGKIKVVIDIPITKRYVRGTE